MVEIASSALGEGQHWYLVYVEKLRADPFEIRDQISRGSFNA